MITSFSLYLEARKKRDNYAILYHGTAKKNLRGILSHGLLTEPPKKVWHDDEPNVVSPSKKAYGGIYLTNNLMTAMLSAFTAVEKLGGNPNTDRIIVVVKANISELVFDEDHVKHLSPMFFNEYLVGKLYVSWKNNVDTKQLEFNIEKYIKNTSNYILNTYFSGQAHPDFENQLKDALKDLYLSSLERVASYLDKKYFYVYTHEEEGIQYSVPVPSQVAEQKYALSVDRLARLLRNSINKEYLRKGDIRVRIMRPIYFFGKNKIISIVGIPDYRKPIELYYGKIVDKFVQDYKMSIGEWPGYVRKTI